MSSRAEDTPPVSVVTAVGYAASPEDLTATLDAVRAQVYDVTRVVVVGDDARQPAEAEGVEWSPTTAQMLESLDTDITYVWFVHSGALPRPDALGSLVQEAVRNDAALAGSKLLDRDDPERLISVGLATDVFDVPYTGLEPDERDAGQYDVVRDVAAVDGASLLARKDLARGIGGSDPKMAPLSASIDLSQRARLRGARVIVVPSSEVLYPGTPRRSMRWREDAGQIRAMAKIYSPLTLIWALPLALLTGLVEAVIAPFVGRWTFFSWVRAWLWNLFRIPSTISGRRQARTGRVTDDAELFRYQVKGSVKIRAMWAALATGLRARLGTDSEYSITDLGKDLRQPSFVTGAIAVVFVVIATRQIWSSGLPAVRYSLPLPASGWDTLAAYAGGWNPAELGSVEALHPFFAAAGALHVVLFDATGLATSVLVAGALLLGIWGTNRLLRLLDIEVVAAVAAGAVLMAGPGAQAIADDTGVPTLMALGILPWALFVALSPWPERWPSRIGRLLAAGWVTGVVALLSPVIGLVPMGAMLIWALINFRQPAAWRAAGVAVVGTLLALPILFPWIAAADLSGYVGDGAAFWDPSAILAVIVAIAFVGAVIATPLPLALTAGWGGVLVALGALLARSSDIGGGREVEHLGMALAGLGVAVIVAVTFEGVRRVNEVIGWRRTVVAAASVAAAFIVASTALVLVGGRAGLPGDELTDRIGFTGLADGDPASSRILLIGPPETMPGESNSVRGASYRVVSAPIPDMMEAWVPPVGPPDEALTQQLEAMIDGEVFRAGEALAPFGIRWIISLGDTPFEAVFEGQLDLVPLGASEGLALTTEATQPVRAETVQGQVPWRRAPFGYEGTATPARVYVAEAGHQNWGMDWAQSGWANEVVGSAGEIRFNELPNRRTQAFVALAVFVVLLVGSAAGRRIR